MQANHCNNAKAVIWCITPTLKMDTNLQAQAEFIQMLSQNGKEPWKIWNNVVIICAGKVRKNENFLKLLYFVARKSPSYLLMSRVQ